MDEYDLIVIGSGPAGEKGAAQAAYFGKRVAIIEKEPVPGGAATNTGTLPSKTLRETALFLSGFRYRALDGLQLQVRKHITVRDFMAREEIVKQRERTRILENLERHHIDLHYGTAAFLDAQTVTVRLPGSPDRQLRAEKFLIATGSHPHRPTGFHFEDPRIYDSNEILDLQRIPKSLLAIGGGVIGCEYACMFAALGVEVTVVEKADGILGFLDHDVTQALRAQMERTGIRVLTSEQVESVGEADPIPVRLKSGLNLTAEAILISAGRDGNTAGLGLEALGIAVNSRGQVGVNEHFQTAQPNIYAAGDVIGNPALASTAMEQARVAMVHAFDLKYKETISPLLPSGIYTVPECAMVGQTEEALKAKNIPYVAGKACYSDNVRGQIIGDNYGFLKLLFREPDLQLVGVHMMGEQATELVHIGLTAMQMSANADLFIRSCYNYPTLTEVYKYATYDALRNRGQASSLS